MFLRVARTEKQHDLHCEFRVKVDLVKGAQELGTTALLHRTLASPSEGLKSASCCSDHDSNTFPHIFRPL